MTTSIIREKVSILDSNLNSNYKEYILQKMKSTYEKTCTNANGFIISINKIITIHDNRISSGDSVTVFDVSFEAECIKPKEGDIVEGEVCLVEPYCILVNIHKNLKVIISSKEMGDYEYDKSLAGDEAFVYKKKRIGLDSLISLELITIKYEKKKYTCIGSLKHPVYK